MILRNVKIIWSTFGGSSLLIPVVQWSIFKGCVWYTDNLYDESLRSDRLRYLRLCRNMCLIRGFGTGLGTFACFNMAWFVGTRAALLSFGTAIGQSGSPGCTRKRGGILRKTFLPCVVGTIIGGLVIKGTLIGKWSFNCFHSAYHFNRYANQFLEQSVRNSDNGGTFP